MANPSTPFDLTGTGYCASFNFRRTARAVTTLFDNALQKTGIRSTQFAILTAIAKIQPVSIGRISEVLIIDRTTLTRSLKLMEKEGFLAISPRGAMRQRFLSLTSKGEKALTLAIPEWRKIQQRFVDEIGSNHWIALRSELEDLAKLAVSMEQKP
jgi:DNA-binding MarR family transcriptional regulator